MNILPFPIVSNSPVHALLDIGSHKIMCLIVRLHRPSGDERASLLPGRTHRVEVLGVGLQRSHGIKSGIVVDAVQAQRAIRRAVDIAERSASMHIEGVRLCVSSGRLSSIRNRSSIDISGEIGSEDLRELLKLGCRPSSSSMIGEGRVILHAIAHDYLLDGIQRVRDPIGMVGDSLSVDVSLITSDRSSLDNIELCLNRCHLSLTGVVASPFSSGLSCLLPDESDLGTVCIDMGSGTTTFCIFQSGRPVFVDGITIGSHHVSMDLARCLSIGLMEAEHLKVKYGTVIPMAIDEGEMVCLSALDSWNQVCVGQLSVIIRSRIEETFELIRDRIRHSGYGHILDARVVLTGGGSQLGGLCDLASSILGTKCRIGRPLGISGLAFPIRGPSFSAICGLSLYGNTLGLVRDDIVSGEFSRPFSSSRVGLFSRMGNWLKESF